MDTSKRLHPDREGNFPNLAKGSYGVTSGFDEHYNCIAWAIDEKHTDEFWTPFSNGGGYYWPDHYLPRNADIETFVKLYQIEGRYFEVENENDKLEVGIEKTALYVDKDGEVTHAARQKPDGVWTSKLGDWEDIDHATLNELCGDYPAYGIVKKILRRARAAP